MLKVLKSHLFLSPCMGENSVGGDSIPEKLLEMFGPDMEKTHSGMRLMSV